MEGVRRVRVSHPVRRQTAGFGNTSNIVGVLFGPKVLEKVSQREVHYREKEMQGKERLAGSIECEGLFHCRGIREKWKSIVKVSV